VFGPYLLSLRERPDAARSFSSTIAANLLPFSFVPSFQAGFAGGCSAKGVLLPNIECRDCFYAFN
jgi:hypothetical protein